MRRHLVHAGGGLAGIGLASLLGYVIATQATALHDLPTWPYYLTAGVCLVGVALYLVGQERPGGRPPSAVQADGAERDTVPVAGCGVGQAEDNPEAARPRHQQFQQELKPGPYDVVAQQPTAHLEQPETVDEQDVVEEPPWPDWDKDLPEPGSEIISDDHAADHPVILDRWQARASKADWAYLHMLRDNIMSHPGYMKHWGSGERPHARFGVMVACDPLEPSTPTTSEIWESFLAFLRSRPIMRLVEALTEADPPHIEWCEWDGNGRMNFGAVLLQDGDDDETPPRAWARILLPDPEVPTHIRDARSAAFLLHVEPQGEELWSRSEDRMVPQPPAPLGFPAWYDVLVRALALPAALAEFVTDDLGLTINAEPHAQLAAWLKAGRSLTELVDVGDLESLPGSAQSPWFEGNTVAALDGQPAGATARELLRQMCDYTLHLKRYEPVLASLGQKSTQHESP